MYSEKTLRRKAKAIGLYIEKDFVRFANVSEGNPIVYDWGDEYGRKSGYMISDIQTGGIVDGYNGVMLNTMDLEDVNDFLKEAYKAEGLQF